MFDDQWLTLAFVEIRSLEFAIQVKIILITDPCTFVMVVLDPLNVDLSINLSNTNFMRIF